MSVLESELSPEAVSQAMMAKDAAAKMLGIELVSITEGQAVMIMTIRPDMLNGFSITHGGLMFTLADTAFAYACNSYGPLTVASSASIEFLLATHEGDVITATANCVHQGYKTGIYEIILHNQKGDKVALCLGRSYRLSAQS